MSSVNLPASLFDMFQNINDRINRLELGYNGPQASADAAQGLAVQASSQAVSAQTTAVAAQIAAATASVQALSAQSSALLAQAQAVSAQNTALYAQAIGVSAQTTATTAQATAVSALNTGTYAQATAVSAQATAASAASQATIAQSTATFAQALAYSASAQATTAYSQAVIAQTSANGKNTITYSLFTPGSTANTAGDIWFQYSGSGNVIGQFVGLGGTSWQQQTITQSVIGVLDAGKITTGTLSAIEINAGTGGTAFHVSPSGYMSAQGVYIKGNITADTGTFNGVVNANSGYFGSALNGWNISSAGLVGQGTGYIAGGTIQGTQFINGSGTFYVDPSGNMVAQSVYVQGVIKATSGYIGSASSGWNISAAGLVGTGSGYIAGGTIQGTAFTNGGGTFFVNSSGDLTATSAVIRGTIQATSGYFGSSTNGWVVNSTGITGVGGGYIAGGYIQGTVFTNGSGFSVDASGNLTASSATITGTIYANNGHIGGFNIVSSDYLQYGTTYLYGNSSLNTYAFYDSSRGVLANTFYAQSTSSTAIYSTGGIFASGNLNIGGSGFISGNFEVDTTATVTYNSTNYNIGLFGTGNGGTVAGRMYKTTSVSSKRFKHNIEPFIQRDYLNIVSKLNPVTFNYNADVVDNPEVTAYGLIAEDVQEIPQTEDIVIIGADGLPESIAYDRLQWYVIKSISQLNDRLTKLEGK